MPYDVQGRFDLQTDAFNRLEVANPFTEGDYPFTYGLQPKRFDAIPTGTATITHSPTYRTVQMKVPAIGDKAIFATRKYHTYQAAKGQKYVFSLTPGLKAGIIRRFGAFDDRNGLFFEIDEDTKIYAVLRSDVTGDVVDTKVDITSKLSWMNMRTNNLFFLDYQWLGAGIADLGCEQCKGSILPLHMFDNPNKNVGPYMAYGSLPIRAEIEAVSATADTLGEMMTLTCFSVVSSGGTEPPQKQFEQSNGSLLSLSTTAETVVLAIRLSELIGTFDNRGLVFPSGVELDVTDGPVRFRGYLYSSAPAGTWTAVSDQSMVEYATDVSKPADGQKILDKILMSVSGTNNRAAVVSGGHTGFTKTNMTRNHLNTDSDCLIITATKINSGDTPKVSVAISGGETL